MAEWFELEKGVCYLSMRAEISFPLSSRAVAVRISLLYIVGSALWIVFSDAILHRLIWNAPGVVWPLETIKGLIYVAVSGTLLGIIIYRCHRDIERSRLVTESKLRKLRESGLIGIYAYAADGTITQANKAFLNMLGYSKEDLRDGRVRLDRLTPDDFLQLSASIDRDVAAHGYSRLYEEELIRKDDTRVPILGGRALMGDDDAHGIGYTLDISQLKTAEAERENLRSQLIQSEKLNALGQLAAGIAHDLNNLLAVIIGSEFLLKSAVDSSNPAYDNINLSIRAANQAVSLTRKLLAFASKQPFEPQSFDLNKVVDQQCEVLRRLIGRNIEIRFLPGSDSWVRADPTHVEQILLNLLLNARDAIEGSGVITIRTHTQSHKVAGSPAEQEYVALTVEDSGKGIEPGILHRIFEPFFTTKEKHAGAGLGLSTVYGIVKQNDGEISVQSVVGQGTTFTVLLPKSQPRKAADYNQVA
jgi:PAS domain S-box-containing protein